MPLPIENRKGTSKIVHQCFNCHVRLLRDGLESFGFDLPVHRHTRMQTVFDLMTRGTRLPDKFKAQPLQCAAHFIARKVAGKFHATRPDKTGS